MALSLNLLMGLLFAILFNKPTNIHVYHRTYCTYTGCFLWIAGLPFKSLPTITLKLNPKSLLPGKSYAIWATDSFAINDADFKRGYHWLSSAHRIHNSIVTMVTIPVSTTHATVNYTGAYKICGYWYKSLDCSILILFMVPNMVPHRMIWFVL